MSVHFISLVIENRHCTSKSVERKSKHRTKRETVLVLLQVPRGWNGFAYVCAGSGRICGTQGSSEHALVFGPGDHVTATTNDESGLRFLLVAGQPIGEPVRP